MPLRRVGLDPSRNCDGAGEPVSRLPMPFGLRGWLVTGYEESRDVLAAEDTFSNDFSHMVGKVGIAAEDDPGGLGFADPPVHTRLRHDAHAGVHHPRGWPGWSRAIRQIIDEALDDVDAARRRRRSRSTCGSSSRCRSRRA